MNIVPANWTAIRIADDVLRKHRIPDENTCYRMGDRPKEVVDAIIRDIQTALSETEE